MDFSALCCNISNFSSIFISLVSEQPRILEKHFHDLQKKYGAVVAVDLVNTHGGEGRLYERYARSIEPILSEDIRFIHFDFHRICGHIHFERLSQLYDQLEDYLKKHRCVPKRYEMML
ncbi:hypothetical protein PR202_ga24409 [Eleusine coracana subsp. coracana]|uniref:SAC domain-containing protein n=1 Tax=Eleusine coracana subsp. coracana TaxID=191504 RepID=A0AAV5D9E4_ELECO|nr:hypothetical protein PR202_ga24409 [Eleusine coracana subsp. coracana]